MLTRFHDLVRATKQQGWDGDEKDIEIKKFKFNPMTSECPALYPLVAVRSLAPPPPPPIRCLGGMKNVAAAMCLRAVNDDAILAPHPTQCSTTLRHWLVKLLIPLLERDRSSSTDSYNR